MRMNIFAAGAPRAIKVNAAFHTLDNARVENIATRVWPPWATT